MTKPTAPNPQNPPQTQTPPNNPHDPHAPTQPNTPAEQGHPTNAERGQRPGEQPQRPNSGVPQPPAGKERLRGEGEASEGAGVSDAGQPQTTRAPAEGDLTQPPTQAPGTTTAAAPPEGDTATDATNRHTQAATRGHDEQHPPTSRATAHNAAASAAATAPHTYSRVVAVVQHQIVEVDGVPASEFARDLPIPLEARERLIKAAGKELFGREPEIRPNDPEIARLSTVGALIDRLTEEWTENDQRRAGGTTGAGS